MGHFQSVLYVFGIIILVDDTPCELQGTVIAKVRGHTWERIVRIGYTNKLSRCRALKSTDGNVCVCVHSSYQRSGMPLLFSTIRYSSYRTVRFKSRAQFWWTSYFLSASLLEYLVQEYLKTATRERTDLKVRAAKGAVKGKKETTSWLQCAGMCSESS